MKEGLKVVAHTLKILMHFSRSTLLQRKGSQPGQPSERSLAICRFQEEKRSVGNIRGQNQNQMRQTMCINSFTRKNMPTDNIVQQTPPSCSWLHILVDVVIDLDRPPCVVRWQCFPPILCHVLQEFRLDIRHANFDSRIGGSYKNAIWPFRLSPY